MNTRHINNKYCDICKDNFKTNNELIEQKQLLHTESINATDDVNVLVDGQDCKLCGFKINIMQNMKAHKHSQHELKCKMIYSSS